ncbi:hypothetical protein Adt_39571 [Abeliophyllum distichum]|uniref:Uncharacterized protein n=1 Tax=Abeliophyllum distichum TaxID=126358 RepID=A0ABD1Q5G7_9LAMI
MTLAPEPSLLDDPSIYIIHVALSPRGGASGRVSFAMKSAKACAFITVHNLKSISNSELMRNVSSFQLLGVSSFQWLVVAVILWVAYLADLTGMKFNMAGMLGFLPLATNDEGASFSQAGQNMGNYEQRKRTSRKQKYLDARHQGHAGLQFSHMSNGLSNRRIEYIEKVLEVYNRKVLTLQVFLVRVTQCLVTDLKVVDDETSKEVSHLKKKTFSLKKFYEASEAQVNEQEKEIDNL